MSKVIFGRGIQGSGKSTAAKAWEKEDPDHRIIINWDSYRNGHGTYWVPSREKIVQTESVSAMKAAMSLKMDIWIDNMNLSENSKKPFLDVIEAYNKLPLNQDNKYSIEYRDFFIPVEECIRRDALRPNPIGAAIIRQTWNRYRTMICALENEKVANRVKQPVEGLEKAIVFDLDATLAFNLSGRPYWGEGCAEGITHDAPNIPIINMAKVYNKAGYHILIVTGREGTKEVQEATLEWLKKYEVPSSGITWRPVGDRSKGQEHKLRSLNALSEHFNIELVVDDSQKIVDCLRENGYTVLQPNEGKF